MTPTLNSTNGNSDSPRQGGSRIRMGLVSCLVTTALTGASQNILAGQLHSQEPLNIGSRLELFVDDYLIEDLKGLDLKVHRPREGERVLHFDQPWEGNIPYFINIYPDGDIYRMNYRGRSDPDYVIQQELEPGEKVMPTHEEAACYAESRDGIHWVRTSLEQVEFQGSRDNNILDLKGASRFVPFKDPNPQAPAESRYKAVAYTKRGEKPGLVPLHSHDGLHWEWMSPEAVITDGYFDSQNIAFWDGERGRYVALYRDFKSGIRTLKYATSKDFLKWSTGQWVEYGDAPQEHLYTNATVPYFRAPHLFLAFPNRFSPWRIPMHLQPGPIGKQEKAGPNRTGLSDAVFMSSRDGLHWYRFMEAFIRPGRDRRNWIHRNNIVGRGIVPTGPDELSLYVIRHYTYPTAHLLRVSVRTDGFASLHAGYPGGEMVTRPLTFHGSELILNYSTSATGSIQLEVQDADGHPIPGFSLQDCIPIWGDEIEGRARWRHPTNQTDQHPLKRLAGAPVRLRFVMKDADLYSLRFR